MHFQAAISSMQNFDIFCPNHGAHSGKTKTSEILQEFFKIQLSKVNLNPEPFPVLSFSECLVCVRVCFVYLHHVCQHYLCFTGWTKFENRG